MAIVQEGTVSLPRRHTPRHVLESRSSTTSVWLLLSRTPAAAHTLTCDISEVVRRYWCAMRSEGAGHARAGALRCQELMPQRQHHADMVQRAHGEIACWCCRVVTTCGRRHVSWLVCTFWVNNRHSRHCITLRNAFCAGAPASRRSPSVGTSHVGREPTISRSAQWALDVVNQ